MAEHRKDHMKRIQVMSLASSYRKGIVSTHSAAIVLQKLGISLAGALRILLDTTATRTFKTREAILEDLIAHLGTPIEIASTYRYNVTEILHDPAYVEPRRPGGWSLESPRRPSILPMMNGEAKFEPYDHIKEDW